jgi:2-dehydropantoate 2-reductase
MGGSETIYILGSGAVGLPLAAYLVSDGKHAVAVRTSRSDVPRGTITVSVRNGADDLRVPVETVSLSQLPHVDGMIAITAKSYANTSIAPELRSKAVGGPLVLLQNGVGVERAFLEAGFPRIYRCILYVTSQATAENAFAFRPITSSPIGIVKGNEPDLEKSVRALATSRFPFHPEKNIQRETWKKAIINSVFNSICPLLEVDNGIFVRDKAVASLAEEVVGECVTLTDRLSLGLTQAELMEQILRISKGSDGQLISTLQDIRNGRETEIEFLNLEIARVAASCQPKIDLPRTAFLGQMILARSRQRHAGRPS